MLQKDAKVVVKNEKVAAIVVMEATSFRNFFTFLQAVTKLYLFIYFNSK